MVNPMLEEKLSEVGNDKKCPVAVMVRNGKVLTGQRNYTKDTWKNISVWTIPGGRCDAGETLEQTLRREAAEEVGITDFKIEDFIGEVPGAKDGDIVPMFYCTTTQDAKLMEPEKFSEWRWVTAKEYIEEEKYSGFNPTARKMIINYLSNVKTK
jgi:8-oxo-dGTP pyrophosphatase MutT (NUDIX family)